MKFPVKHAYLLLSVILVALSSCKKSDDTADPSTNNPPGNSSISPVPGSFSQKVLIEQFTGAWNGGCPDGIYRMDQLTLANQKTIGVNIHMGDAMETPAFNELIALFNNNSLPQFPSAMVSRIPSLGNVILSKTQWASNATVNLSRTASCGLALKSTVSGNTATLEVHAGFKSNLTGTYHVTVYLVENNVTGTGSMYDQVNNNTSNDPSSPYYNKPTPMAGFVHNNVLRKVVSATSGDEIPPSKVIAGGVDIKTYSIDITGKDISNLKIVAFINKIGSSAVTHEVMNVQTAAPGTVKNWD